jgi:hypothetical protein
MESSRHPLVHAEQLTSAFPKLDVKLRPTV